VRSVADDKALVVRLEHDDWRALFTSDSGFFTEQWLVQNEPDLRADLLVKGQHAKDFSGTPEFLARVQPQAIVCSALGYGVHPTMLDRWAQRAGAQGIAVFRQDQCGATQVEFRDGAFTVRGFVNAQTFRGDMRLPTETHRETGQN
jgi:beta-lactamase superfamily II metal-dependent hydrolase